MDDVVLVINAGSSSLKFCVYNAAADGWRLNTRGDYGVFDLQHICSSRSIAAHRPPR